MNNENLTSEHSLINKAETLAKTLREAEYNLIECLQQIDQKRLYSNAGIKSLYNFCVERLKMDEARSYNFVKATRMAKVYPAINNKLISGKTNLGNISKVATFFDNNPTIKKDERERIIESIENKTSKECTTLLLLNGKSESDFLRKTFQEIIRTVSSEHKRLSVTLHDETIKRVDRIKNLSAHRGIFSYEKTIDFMAHVTLKKIDPTNSNSIAIKQRVWKRANGACEKCGSEFGLEIDHVVPLAKGGSNDFSNLRLLCKSCNQAEAIKVFGAEHMSKFLK